MNRVGCRILLPAALFLGAAVHAEVMLTATLTTNTIQVGDRVTLTLTAAHDASEHVTTPAITREPFIMVWNTDTKTEDTKDGRKETATRITFSSFVIGEHRVATNPVIILGADVSERALPFPELLINVGSVLTNPPPSLADIKPPVKLPGYEWLRILGVMAAVMAVAALAAWWIRAWLKRPTRGESARVIPPHEIALRALDALRRRGYIEAENVEPFYVEVSSIVRIYLEDRFDLHAPEQTTEEFIRTSSASSVLTLDQRTLTQAFLEQSDLVKFARFRPTGEDMNQAWNAADKLVRETVPAPATASGGAT
jgi:hypothetical protein